MAYRRGSGMACIVNFGDEPILLPHHDELLLASDANQDGSMLATDCAVWIH